MTKLDLEDRDWELDDHDWSDKAWISVTDAELFETVLLRKARELDFLEVLEWGSGKSTLYYTGRLVDAGVPFRWLSLEYDRDYFRADLAPRLDELSNPAVYYIDDQEPRSLRLPTEPPERSRVEFVVFDKGRLQPMLRSGKADRAVDMDTYVEFPAGQGRRFDLVLVDGRKRRRCLLQAADRLLADRGVALLHNAWRPYYHCAFDAFATQRRIGDILWIGTQEPEEYLGSLLEGRV